MFKRTHVCSAITVALGGTLAIAAQPAAAQQTQPAQQLIEVTGSRIKTLQTDTASPVLSVSADEIKIQGITSAEQLLNNLPQVFADYSTTMSSGASGTATVNLRGLGASRTLVLVNGRRLPQGGPRNLAADLNQIPMAMVRRVEILTGGASAVYGSDAIAGVVNFIMNDNFQGVQLDFTGGFYNHRQHNPTDYALTATNQKIPGNVGADGQTSAFGLTLGGNFAGDKGNAVVYVGVRHQNPVISTARDFAFCPMQGSGTGYTCIGSSTSYPGRFFNNATGKSYTLDASGNPIPFTNDYTYNFAALNSFQSSDVRYNLNAVAHYTVSDKARIYTELSMLDDETVSQNSPGGIFFGVPYTVGGANPLISDAMKATLGISDPASTKSMFIGRRLVEGPPRQDDMQTTSLRAVIGVKGDVGAWSYDVSTQAGKVVFKDIFRNDVSKIKIQNALNVVTDPATGKPVCQSVLNGSDPKCVPLNIWTPSGMTPAALDYVLTPGLENGGTSQLVTQANGSVDLGSYGIKLPGARDGVSLAFGAEYRKESMNLNTDQEYASGDLTGQFGPIPSAGGGYNVRDIFVETRVPILAKKALAEQLDFNASYRNSSYSTGNKTNTYGAGLEWAPIKQYKFRTSFQRAVRAPNIMELYAAQTPSQYNSTNDPCEGANPIASADKCAQSGVTAAQYGNILVNPVGRYNSLSGGNPDLQPESSNSFTVGLVVQPIREFTATLDYYDIKVSNVISSARPNISLAQCLAGGNPVFCNLVHRDPGTGALWLGSGYVASINANLAEMKTTGLDVGMAYRLALAGGSAIDFNLVGSYLESFKTQPLPGLGSYDCAGYYGPTCGVPAPKWRHKLRASWELTSTTSLWLNWTHFGSVHDEGTNPSSLLAATVAPVVATLSSNNTFDVGGSYQLTKNIEARLAINNVMDKDPPLGLRGSPYGNANTYPSVYPSLGRQFTLGLTAKF